MEMDANSRAQEFRDRTKSFAMRVVRLYQSLPSRPDAQILGKQLLRSGTSVAANHRAVYRARSKAEFISKICVVLEEADESVFWIELLGDCGIVPKRKLEALHKEAIELVKIFSAARRTSKL